jgi:DNA-binding MarR family transcriptional regulator
MVQDVVRTLGYLMLGTRMKRIGERLQASTQRVIDGFAVPVQAGQWPFLAALDTLGAVSVGELAEAIGITQPGATRTVGQLVRQGLVEVEQAADDQRRRIVSLSREGQRLVAAAKLDIWPSVSAAVADLCDPLEGPLLQQLAALEDELAAVPLARRIGRKKQ